MKERINKFFSLLVFFVLLVVIISLGISSTSTEEKNNFSGIEIYGGKLLSSTDYLSYTGFKDTSALNKMSLPSTKNRFEKHPYILRADVEFDGNSKILVEIIEREFKAVLLEKKKFNLLTENYEKIPVLRNTVFYELPIITNAKILKPKGISERDRYADIRQAFKIIDALKYCDEELYKNLAEVNLNKGGDVILTFTGLEYPVIFGRGDEARKVLSLKNVWDQISGSGGYSGDEYLDLRFNNQILIGINDIGKTKQ